MIKNYKLYHRLAMVLIAISVTLIAAPIQAAQILVVGDSWGVAAGLTLPQALINNGSPETVASIAVGGQKASDLNTPEGLQSITTALEANPDAVLVHLSIGGNDFLGSWNFLFTSSQEEQLIADILNDITAIVDHLLAQRPEIRIYWSSYDFPRPIILLGTPAEVNAASLRFSVRAQALADSRGIYLTYGDFNGLAQVTYGFDGVQESAFDPNFAIPAGDPSLPDPQYPSPAVAYLDLIHYTTAAYLMLAEKQYQNFYLAALETVNFKINAGLNDAWFNALTDGQGFFITVFPGKGLITLAWFTYDTQLPANGVTAEFGNPGHRWLTALGEFVDNRAVLSLTNTSGGLFDDPTAVSRDNNYGTIIITFLDCDNATIEYNIPSLGLVATIPITRVVADNIALCNALQ